MPRLEELWAGGSERTSVPRLVVERAPLSVGRSVEAREPQSPQIENRIGQNGCRIITPTRSILDISARRVRRRKDAVKDRASPEGNPDHKGVSPEKNRGHHLADPDQWHSIFPILAAKPRFLSAARRRDRTKNASSVFFVDGNGFLPDPHQSPFWIQALGLLPQGSRHPAPGSYEPQKTLGSLTLSKCFRSLLIQAARRAAPTTRLRNHRSMAGGTYPTPTPRWLRTEAHQS